MKRRKYLFYPYQEKSYGFIKGLLYNDNLVDVISPEGSGLVGNDMAYATNRGSLDLMVKSINEIDFTDYEQVILSSHTSFHDEVKNLIHCSIKADVPIIYLGEEQNILDILNSYDKSNATYLSEHMQKIKTLVRRFNEVQLELYSPNIPVVYIGGIIETIDSFDIGLQIKLRMEKMGYKVSLISNNPDGGIFSVIKFPEDMMGMQSSFEDTIISLNRWVQAVNYLEKPDIILMDIPKGMMQYSDSFHNSFGIYSLLLAQTLPPDYLVLTIPPSFLAKEYIAEIDKYFENKLGRNIDALNVTNIRYEMGGGDGSLTQKPLYLPENEIDEMIKVLKDSELNLMNLNKEEYIEAVVSNILNNFS